MRRYVRKHHVLRLGYSSSAGACSCSHWELPPSCVEYHCKQDCLPITGLGRRNVAGVSILRPDSKNVSPINARTVTINSLVGWWQRTRPSPGPRMPTEASPNLLGRALPVRHTLNFG